ncbi:MAG: glycoside hydrolase family 3 C-terminal domain-containing protein [Bacilli bacterium]|nr:glycoside hydrolase family 3 C-terminal domain-containing protein [Bacilli bacterium]
MAKPKLWLGLSATSVALLALILAAQKITTDKAGIINDALGLNQTKIDAIDSDEVEGSAYADANGSLSDSGCKQMIADAYKFCEEAVEQGSVLFKNNKKNGKKVLPLEADERNVTLFGRGSRNLFMRSGAGGAAPNPSLVVKLDKAFEDAGFHVNQEVFKKYSKLSQSSMTSPGTNVEDSVSIYNDVKDTFDQYSDAAIVTFVRIGTENTDPSDGQLDLKSNEKDLLRMIKDSGQFKKTIVLINSPLAMSMDWADKEEYGIDAILYVGVPGYYGASGIPYLLMGKDADGKPLSPSGHAVNTFAASASSSPAYVNFNRDAQDGIAVYQEGVYVGYKYYETRYEDAVLGQGNASGTAGKKVSTGNWNYVEEMGYPFGYGESYTGFEQKITSLVYNEEKDTIDAKVQVTNVGDEDGNKMDGKASVQLYVQQPYTQFDKDNKLGKPSISLMAYEKVDVKKNETVTVDVSFDRYFLTTYDYVNEYQTTKGGSNNVKGRYILEGGNYYFAVGNGAHEALNNIIHVKSPTASLVDHNGEAYDGNDDAVATLAITEDTVTYATSHYDETVEVKNQFDDADYNYIAKKNGKTQMTYLDRQDWQGTWPSKISKSNNPASDADSNMRNYYSTSSTDKGYKAADKTEYNVQYVDPDTNEASVIRFSEMSKVPLEGEVTNPDSRFYGEDGAEVWDKFIKQMTLSDLIISVSDNRGILDVEKVKKKGNSVAEGPEGLLSRYQYYDKRWATGFPTGPMYTGTWDHKMQSKFGEFYGEDALFCGVACVNAPGCNINRTPYGSRASEYMSEDGILNYNTAANIVGAARKKGLIMNIKHCFLNNQETNRQGIYTYCNEQAIREIYLRPFEGALTKGKGLGIMTSYNRIGARYAACHEPLMMNVMRGEWKYRGQIIDDALTGSNDSNYSNGPAMLHCGTDLFCLDGGRGGQLSSYINSNDDLTLLKDLQRANKYIMYSISRSMMGGIEFNSFGKKAWQKAIDGSVIGVAGITAVLVGLYAFFEITSKIKSAKAKQDADAAGVAE